MKKEEKKEGCFSS